MVIKLSRWPEVMQEYLGPEQAQKKDATFGEPEQNRI